MVDNTSLAVRPSSSACARKSGKKEVSSISTEKDNVLDLIKRENSWKSQSSEVAVTTCSKMVFPKSFI